ncbi:MAG: exosome complex protein Rrp42 [Candidatus Woesearchaeota archaeon]|nr:exosome complex protein Rrp42 [Candidatus Woesearchaeota archaeon]
MMYAQKEHTLAQLQKGVRADGRKLDEFRKITIDADSVATAEGGARVTCGDTHVIAGVKMALGTPYPDTPDSGVLMVNVELLPMSNPEYEPGPPSIDSIETSRVIDRGIRESHAFDSKSLCVTAGEQVWIVNVDICPVNADGNLIDIGGLAAVAAIKSAKFPEVEDGKVNYKKLSKKPLKLEHVPIPITVVKIGDVLVVDPTYDEWSVADARLTATTIEDGRLCSLQKGGDVPLTIDEVNTIVDLAVKKGKELRKLL